MDESVQVSDLSQDASSNTESNLQKPAEEGGDKVAYETYRKVLSQRKADQEKLSEMQQRLQELEHGRLEAEGKKDELLTNYKRQVSDLTEKVKKQATSYTWNVIGAQVKAKMAQKGVKNPDKAFKYAKSVHEDEIKSIQVDDNYNVDGRDLEMFVDKFLNENSDMGFVASGTVKDMAPIGGIVPKEKEKPLSNLSDEEIMEALQNAN